MIDIEKTLKKNKLTGIEVGKLAIANQSTYYKQLLNNDPNPKYPISDKQMDKIVSSLETEEDKADYRRYVRIFNWTSKYMQNARAQEKQAHAFCESILKELDTMLLAEQIYLYIDQLPIIMTRKQYNEALPIEENERAKENGIAILEDNVATNVRIDKNGYYKPIKISDTIKENSIDKFFLKDGNINKEKIEELNIIREVIISSYYYAIAFNKCIDMIIDIYDIEELKVYKAIPSYIKNLILSINAEISVFYPTFRLIEYEEQKTRQNRLKALSEVLEPIIIDIDKIIIPKKRIRKTKKAIKDFTAFIDERKNPIELLCVYDEASILEELRG